MAHALQPYLHDSSVSAGASSRFSILFDMISAGCRPGRSDHIVSIFMREERFMVRRCRVNLPGMIALVALQNDDMISTMVGLRSLLPIEFIVESL
jgi:hypothetical protein